MLPLRWAYLAARRFEIKRFIAQARHSRRIQHGVLLEKVRRHADSDFGREHGFADIRSVADFRRRMPISTYDDYRPYIERVKRGELGAMFAPGTRLWMFALTSGTSGEPKFIPVTGEFFREYRRGWHLWGAQTYLDHIDLTWKYALQLTSNWQEFYTEGGIPCGQISGLAAEAAPPISRTIFLLPQWLSKIPDSGARRYVALRLSISSAKVGIIITANPSTLIELARLADHRRDSLIRDLHEGTLADDVDVPAEIRRRLAPLLKKRYPKRAGQLESIVERTGSLHPIDFWPRMSVMGVWTGGSVGAYLPRVREYYGDPAFRDHGLSASEGRMTIPFVDGTCAGMLDYETSYFEFIPEEEHDNDHPTVLEAHELEADRNYYIVLTTSSGFYRYDIHDLVRCVGYEGTAPRLEFLNKGSGFANLTGEKISEFQAVSAVKHGFAELDLPFEPFTMAPEFGDPPGYVVLMENVPPGFHEVELAGKINDHLMRLNTEYESKMHSGRLRPVTLRQVPPGTWERLRRCKMSYRGVSVEQYKHPYLVSRLKFLEELDGLSARNVADPAA
jgi:hypothetical protein